LFQGVMNSILTGLGGAPIGGGTPQGGQQGGGGVGRPPGM
jgi:hypothetical protein